MEKYFTSYLALDAYILLCDTFIINQFSGAESITNIKQWNTALMIENRECQSHKDSNMGRQKGKHLNAISDFLERNYWTFFSSFHLFCCPSGLSFSAFNIRFGDIQLSAVPYCLISQ